MSEESLIELPTEDIAIQRQPTPVSTKVDSKDFGESLLKELSDGNVWRTSKALAEKMNVDVVELDAFLRKQQAVCSRPSKTEGVFLYALVKRIEVEKPKENPKVEAALRPLVSEEDRYALGILHSAFQLLDGALDKYAMKIYERNSEAFTKLVEGKDKLEAGLVLFGQKIKADFTKLPKV
jgi:hypothetical protein